jgi:hypothetical protein
MEEESEMRTYWMQDACGPDGKPRSTQDLEDLQDKSIEEEHSAFYAVDWDLSQRLTHPHLLKQPAEVAAPISDEVKGHIQATLTGLHKQELTMGRLFGRQFGSSLQNFVEYILSPRMRSDSAKQTASDASRLNTFGNQAKQYVSTRGAYTETMLRPTKAQLKEWATVESDIAANLVLYKNKSQNKEGLAFEQAVYSDVLAVSNTMTWEVMPTSFSAMLEAEWGHDQLFRLDKTASHGRF